MPANDPQGEHLTERQKKWFASVRAGLERDTGRSLDDWVTLARTCPETGTMARINWLRTNHGLGMNRANQVMSAAFPTGEGWDQGEKLRATLWTDPQSEAILQAFAAAVAKLPDITTGQRKSFTAFSRKVQMAAIRPVKGGKAMAGFAVETATDPRLTPRGNESWGDRLKGQLLLTSPDQVDASIEALLQQAWERS